MFDACRPKSRHSEEKEDEAAVKSSKRDVLTLAGITAVYVLAGKLGLAVAFVHVSASAVWPPTGIALAALLLFGYRLWPAVFVGAFIVNYTNAGSFPISASISLGNTLEAVAGTWLLRRFAGGTAALIRPQGVFRFAFLAAAATTVSATVGSLTLWIGGAAEAARVSTIWLTWWLGDTVGALVFAPLILLWARPAPAPAPRRSPLEAIALAITVALVGGFVFSRLEPAAFATLPPLVWAALRFGRRAAVTAATGLSGIALWGTLRSLGPFATGGANESLLYLQTFVGIVTLTALALAAAVRERDRVEGSLRQVGEELERRVRERTASLGQAVEELARSRAVLSEAQRVAHIGSWEWDISHDQVTWSDELYRIYGLEPGSIEVTYTSYLDRVHPEDRESTTIAIREALDSGGQFEFEERIVRPDGSVRALQSKGYVVLDESELPTRMIGTCHDISGRKEAEIELARRIEALHRTNNELSLLSYAASHDLREPLRTVVSHVQLVDRHMGESGDPEVRRSIAFAVEGVRRMEELVTDLLEYSRADHRSSQEVDAERALGEALSRLAVPIRESGAQIETGRLPRVTADQGRLVRLFQNLVSNAIKYARDGVAPVVRISAERNREVWCFSVADNGRGFAPPDAERIFGVFERLDEDPGVPGTGIGLAICRRIVEAQGGRIWAESEPGRGTVLRFTLPAAADGTGGPLSSPPV